MRLEELPDVVTLAEAAAVLGIGENRALRMVKAGTFPIVPAPWSPRRSGLYLRRDLERLLGASVRVPRTSR